jgi:hypothetical protein
VVSVTAPSTINCLEEYATSIAAADASTWSSLSDGSSVASAKP